MMTLGEAHRTEKDTFRPVSNFKFEQLSPVVLVSNRWSPRRTPESCDMTDFILGRNFAEYLSLPQSGLVTSLNSEAA